MGKTKKARKSFGTIYEELKPSIVSFICAAKTMCHVLFMPIILYNGKFFHVFV